MAQEADIDYKNWEGYFTRNTFGTLFHLLYGLFHLLQSLFFTIISLGLLIPFLIPSYIIAIVAILAAHRPHHHLFRIIMAAIMIVSTIAAVFKAIDADCISHLIINLVTMIWDFLLAVAWLTGYDGKLKVLLPFEFKPHDDNGDIAGTTVKSQNGNIDIEANRRPSTRADSSAGVGQSAPNPAY